MLKKMFAAIGVLMVVGVIGSAMGEDESTAASDSVETTATTDESSSDTTDESDDEEIAEVTDEEPAAEEKKPTKVQTVKVQAGKIVKEFEQNELNADSSYKGKTLQVTGKVLKIDTEFLDDEKYILSLGKSKWDFLTVNCHDMSNDELATLKVGQSTTVVGTFDDGGDLGVEVENCKLA